MSTPDNRLFSLAVAHGVTQRVVDTWFEFLPRTPRVMVPIHVEALIVRQAGAQWAKCGMTPPADDAAPVEVSTLLPPPFTDLDAPRPKGAYLHWALPDALCRGTQTQAEVTFPAIPDRWLVLRLYPSPRVANRRTVRGWILQAHDNNPVPLNLDGWKEPGKPPEGVKQPLTAVGHGDTSWSGYFDNVENRMAFYDNLADVPVGPIAYVVCGWYSDFTLDPLGDDKIKSLADFEAKMRELRWAIPEKDLKKAANSSAAYVSSVEKAGLATSLSAKALLRNTAAFADRPLKVSLPGSTPEGPPYTTNGAWWPENSLFHGSVVAIGWPGIGWPGNENGVLSGEEGGPPAAGAVRVAFANTLAEGLASLVAKQNNSVKDARILEAFQQGLLNELNEPDGRARVDASLHAAAFGSLPGGEVMDRVWRPPTGTPPPPPDRKPPKVGAGVFERYQAASRAKLEASTSKLPLGPIVEAGKNVQPNIFQARSIKGEVNILKGGIDTVITRAINQAVEPFRPGRWEDVARALPRFFHPMDPVVLVQGVKRSFQFGYDGRYTADGSLECRLSGTCIKEYVQWHGDISYPPIHPDDVLDRGVENGSVPPECEEILGEVAMLDPGSSAPIVQSATRGIAVAAAAVSQEVRRVMTEQTVWWAMRDPRIDHGPILAKSSLGGLLPSPVAVTPPVHPWSPLHLEWRVEFIPSPGGKSDWTLGEVDYNESVPQLPPQQGVPGTMVIEGRAALNHGANTALATAVRRALDQVAKAGGSAKLPAKKKAVHYSSPVSQKLLREISAISIVMGEQPGAVDRSTLEDIATALEDMDALSSALNGLHVTLRGGIPGDGESRQPEAQPVPSPFHHLRAGFLRVLRLRLVDAFGQFVDLAGSGPSTPANPTQLLRSEPLEVTGRPDLLALPPRFTSPARLLFRYMDAAGSNQEASLATDITPGISPVCGYLMPNHLDSALMFYDQAGGDRGVVRAGGDGRIVWEDAPGRPSTVGQSPVRAVPNQFLAGIAEALIEWGVADAGLLSGPDTALDAILRVIDSTLWSVDPFGHQGEEHLALLLGHPVVVMRAVLKLEVKEPVAPGAVSIERVPVRLGSLSHWQDGLFGFFVNDDYKRLYCAPAAAALAREVGPNRGFLKQANAVQQHYNDFGKDIDPQGNTGGSPVTHPYVDTTGVLYVQPNQEVRLTLLVEPHTFVNATSGLAPRKDIGMRREWVKDALAKLSPTFRFGPVLIDPERIRMPIPHDLNGSWSWDHRISVTEWANDPVTHATQDALLNPDPPVGSEGWLRLTPPEPEQ
jgi:hypothetical protein